MDDEAGEVLWSKHYTGTEDHHETAYGLAVGPGGDAYVVGRTTTASHGEDVLALRLAAADGEIVWLQQVDGPAHDADWASGAVATASGDLLVGGVSLDAAGTVDFLALRLAAADGRVLWQKRLPGALNAPSRDVWLAPTGTGDPIMSGRGDDGTIVLMRLAAADGDTLWTTRYDSPVPGWEEPRALRVDGEDNAVLLAVSGGDWLTLRVGGDLGTILWEEFYDGPGGGWDRPAGLALTDEAVLLCGFVDGGASAWDAAVVARDLASGAFLWELIWDGADALSDELAAVAAGPDGDVYGVGYSYAWATDMDLLALRWREDGTAAPGGPAAGARALPAWPNPFRDRTTLRLDLPRGGRLAAAVYDLRGRLVRRLDGTRAADGGDLLVWDGTDAAGRPVPAGLYLVRARAGGEERLARVLRLR
ncbi:MAG: hypothetical protein JW819_02735 [Candidatus Krumholzibacteriota bacterium]|nr:hypothetical protein [Candidatus Krumholzibacteriota bacterium]